MKAIKIIKIVVVIIFCFLFVCEGAIILVPRIMGKKCFAVTSGSMSPAINVGDMVITEDIAFEDIFRNDILTFTDKQRSSAFSHRVIDIDDANKWLYTKGDNNTEKDPVPASYDYVVGKVVYIVPFIGYISIFLTSRYGVITIALLVLLWLAFEIVIKRKKGKK